MLLVRNVEGQESPLLFAETITVNADGPLEFTFRDEGTGATNYVAEFTAALGSTAVWTGDPAAVFTPLGGGAYRVTIGSPLQARGFYRVIGLRASGGAVVANFAAAELQVSEGGMVSVVMHFSAPYTGRIRYTVSGTAGAGDFLPLSGEIQVNNSLNAEVPVTLTDNRSIEELKYLTLRLERGPGLDIGAAAETRLIIDENDAEWRGAISLGPAALGFVLAIEETSDGSAASLRSDPAGIFPLAPAPSTLLFTKDLFESATTRMPLPAESNLYGTAAALTLRLAARNGTANQQVSSNSVRGAAILVTEYEGRPYLNRTNAGSFHLHKTPVNPSAQPVELLQAP
jgi:hypothetical protein